MVTPLATLWDDMLGQVRLNYPLLVRGWFATLKVLDLRAGVLQIRAVNGAQLRYLEQHCHWAFTEAAQAATGRLVTIAFEADESDTEGVVPAGLLGNGADELALKPEFTFEHFITGPCNRLAHAAAFSISQEPGRAYNPFFIHGKVGLGKTHLLQAVCHSIRNDHPDMKCHYISCETFVNRFIEAVEQGALHQFRYRYRHVDVLLIDDVQFLAQRERTQEEFFHTFNTLYQMGQQIILSADCLPSEIPSLENRLVSRFNSGLVARLDQPSLETRIAIVRTKARLRCIELPDDVAQLIASRVDTNSRELEGALVTVDAVSQMQHCSITLQLAQQALGPPRELTVGIPVILNVVAKRLSIKVPDLQSKRRSKDVTQPRHICMYLARKLTQRSLQEIGGYFGGRDHTTVLYASRTIAQRLQHDEQLQKLIDQLTAEVRHAPS